jgi:hypothetical protein
MNFKKIFLGNLFVGLSISSVMAASINHCPSVTAIQQGHIAELILAQDQTWGAFFSPTKYETNTPWTFVLGGGDTHKVNDKNAARAAARQALNTLTFVKGPIAELNGDTVCVYGSVFAEHAIAITPPISFSLASH